MKTYIKALAALAVVGSGFLTSCDLDVENPNTPTSTGYFTSQDRFVLNMIAIMNEWRADFDGKVMMGEGELRSGIYTITGIDGSALNDIVYINNNLSSGQAMYSKFAGFYGVIGNLNNFITEAESKPDLFASQDAYNYLRGMAYGMRAWCYFQVHKMFGTAPLRLEPEVFQGNYDANALYKPRASAEDLLTQIKKDLATSIEAFNGGSGFRDNRITGIKANYWTKAATEMLAGEVYLWSGKVSTDNHTATPADVATAKTYFQNVVNNYGYSLCPTYADVFNPKAKASNPEVIFSTYYGYGVATANWYWASMWNANTGQAQTRYWIQRGNTGLNKIEGANRLGTYIDPATGQQTYNDFWYQQGRVVNRYQYKNAVYYQYDPKDTRRDYQFQACYLVKEDQADINYLPEFDPEDYNLAGAFFYKFQGEVYNNAYSGTNDVPYYRLALAYTYLAEIANYEGNFADVERYINMIRERAYGNNWDATTMAYKATNFRENEVAILQEKTKEFLQEGQRWWDIRRMTAVKDGQASDHLIFQPESCAGWGLDVAAHPNWNEVADAVKLVASRPVITNEPVLDYAIKAHMVLWPIPSSEVVDAESAPNGQPFLQTPGYN